MCGIYGQFPFNSKTNQNALIKALSHRGPDGNGYLDFDEGIFVHTRLSVIDLTKNGDQPMSSKCGRFHIIFNGEIYNFLDLKKKLLEKGYVFYSNSDTEVLLIGFQEWRHKLFNKLNGMFSFCVFDTNKKQLFLVRDRIGIKPLYYIYNKNKLTFSSEVKTLTLSHKLEIDPNSFYDCIQYGAILGNKTIYKEVNSLEPGHYVKINIQKSFKIKKYVNLDRINCHHHKFLSYEDSIIELRSRLNSAIESHLISDTPVGCLLSGGIDSSAILALAQSKASTPLIAFNLAFSQQHSEYDESRVAESTAKLLGAKFQKIEMSSNDVLNLFDNFILSLDQPSNDGFNTYLISSYVSNFVKVALTGLGGDELFGGYSFYNQILSSLTSKKRIFDPLFSNIHKLRRNRFTFPSAFRSLGAYNSVNNFRQQFSNFELKKITGIKRYEHIHESSEELSILQQIFLSERKQYLPNTLLRNADNLGMANGLELRPFFLDNDLVNFAINLNDNFKIKNYKQKSILIDSISDLLPKQILENSKKGFELPYSFWMNNQLNNLAISLFESDILDELINKRFKKHLINLALTKQLQDKHWIFIVMYSWVNKRQIASNL